ncbi:unnamed protein product [Symbiodinium natans]|uniref:Uncharacterized protein n=1 Tax=Symbiodinium natans TaxID=878477 RepID=A0A812V0M9_9DINO|nr:unnamed protein product [Symbiodinium natans]
MVGAGCHPWKAVIAVVVGLVRSSAQSEEKAWLQADVFLRRIVTELGVEMKDVESLDCLSSSQDQLSANMTRALDLVSNRFEQDYLLSLRAGLERLGQSLASMALQSSACLRDDASMAAFKTAVAQMNKLVMAGRVNAGYCPFTGKQQTTLGGSEVGRLLRKLTTIRRQGATETAQKTRKLARVIGKLLREVRDTGDGPDPAGAIPVNWEMRMAMFGGHMEL